MPRKTNRAGPRITGRYETAAAGGETVSAFVPLPLPPTDPPLTLSPAGLESLRRAEHALAKLDAAGGMVPSPNWFIYGFVRKEAVITSQIEGTQATLTDLLTFEAVEAAYGGAQPGADVEEVCGYLNALEWARAQSAKPKGLPLSMRLLNGAHKHLMQGARGAGKQPGEIRRSQNWIGGRRPGRAAHVPPPPNLLPGLMGDLEAYMHAESDTPPLIRTALAHAQFETIHPYLDGNGRIGRLLIALLLEHWGLLRAPLLYISLFFKRNQQEYYRRLNAVRTEGDWEGWVEFFMEGAAETADEAAAAAQNLSALVTAGRRRVLARKNAAASAMRLFEYLPDHPFVTAARAQKLTGASRETAMQAVRTLEAADILRETTGKKRGQIWAYQEYVDLLREEE
ncbi:MAG: Fic family protein [Rhodospirillales bacterium]